MMFKQYLKGGAPLGLLAASVAHVGQRLANETLDVVDQVKNQGQYERINGERVFLPSHEKAKSMPSKSIKLKKQTEAQRKAMMAYASPEFRAKHGGGARSKRRVQKRKRMAKRRSGTRRKRGGFLTATTRKNMRALDDLRKIKAMLY